MPIKKQTDLFKITMDSNLETNNEHDTKFINFSL